MLLPYTIEQDGSYKPDFESQERFEEFQKFLNDFPDITNVEKFEKAKKLPIIMIRKSSMERVSPLNLKNQQMKLSLVGEVCINLLYLCLL